MKKLPYHCVSLFVVLGLLMSFKQRAPGESGRNKTLTATDSFIQREIVGQSIILNPSGVAPLTALIKIKTTIPTRVQICVKGKNGTASDLVKKFDSLNTLHHIPVYGLYADHKNMVQLTLFNRNGKSLGTSAVYIEAGKLYPGFPAIEIITSAPGKKSGMTLVSNLVNCSGHDPSLPFIFDDYGEIRWYLDYSSGSTLSSVNYDNGPERLRNGNFYFGDARSGKVYEVNMFGEIIHSWLIPGYTFHHRVVEKPDGNLLVCVTKAGLETRMDHIVEINRNNGEILNTWDLRRSLQYTRTTQGTDGVDWIHVNGLEYDAQDSCIIVSTRLQGVIKLDRNNTVVWILSPHRGWARAGDGTDLRARLLYPLDKHNHIITDPSILNGYTNHKDFEWNWYQHAAKPMASGNLFLFDNGCNRNYINTEKYSRAVEYKINKKAMTVKQIWQYGKERGEAVYSMMVSDLDYYPDCDHYIVSPGAVFSNKIKSGRVIEVSRSTLEVLFEATITAPASYTGTVFHRTERLELYPR